MSVHRLPEFIPELHYVYALFCQDGDGPGYVKFGRSKQVTKRLSGLRTACPVPAKMFAVVAAGNSLTAGELEKALHSHFEERRSHGEWFRFDFADSDDKRAFNDGCRQMFALFLDPGEWWTKISVAAMDEHERKRRAALLRNRARLKKLMRREARIAKERRAWKELQAYGNSRA